MKIIFHKDDVMLEVLGLSNKSSSDDKIIDALIKNYSYGPIKPQVEIKNGTITINLDIPKIQDYSIQLEEAFKNQPKCTTT